MIGELVSQGRGVAGLHRYLSHDRVVEGEPAPETSDRVAFIRTLGSPTDDANLTVRIMQGIVADRKILKGRSGSSPGGRHLQTAYVHGLVSFAPGETPSEDEQIEAVEGWRRTMGLDEHLTIAYGHTDGGVRHIHIVGCRVHPYTGIAAPMSYGKLRLSTWSREWEEAHGGIVIPARLRRAAERAQFRAAVDEEVAALTRAAPDEPQPATKRDRAKRRAKARREAKAKVRASGAHPMTPITKGRRAGQDDRTPEEKARWTALYADPDFAALTRREKKAMTTALKADMLAKRQAALERAPAPPAEQPPAQVPGIAAVAAPVVAAPPVDTETPVVTPAPLPPEVDEPAPPLSARVEREVDEPVPPPPELEAELETAHGLTTDQQLAAMRARLRLHEVQPEGIPLSNKALRAVAKELRRDGDTTDRVAAYALERTAVLRDRAAGEKAALAEAERTAGALAELTAALIETVRTLCRAALGQSGPGSAPRRPTAATTEAARGDVARDDQVPGRSQAR